MKDDCYWDDFKDIPVWVNGKRTTWEEIEEFLTDKDWWISEYERNDEEYLEREEKK